MDNSADTTNTTDENSDNPSKADASGNLTLRDGEVYESPINITGNLIANANSKITKGFQTGGNARLGDDVDVTGNATVGGNLTSGDNVKVSGNVKVNGGITSLGNATIEGSVTAATLSAGANFDVVGPVFVTSAGSVIYIGDNSTLDSTLTSKAGLQVGANVDIKLFLSGDSIQVDGQFYKLGGRIVKRGGNTTVGLPYIPKPKTVSADNNKVVNDTSVAPTAVDNTNYVPAETVNSNAADVAQQVDAINTDAITSSDDVNSYIDQVSSIDKNVVDVNSSDSSVQVNYKVPATLFGFIPTTLSTDVSVSSDKNVDVKFPWYSFLFSTKTSKADIKTNITNAAKDALNSVSANDTSLSAKAQATILDKVFSGFENLFSK